jgi:hypothetical protein
VFWLAGSRGFRRWWKFSQNSPVFLYSSWNSCMKWHLSAWQWRQRLCHIAVTYSTLRHNVAPYSGSLRDLCLWNAGKARPSVTSKWRQWRFCIQIFLETSLTKLALPLNTPLIHNPSVDSFLWSWFSINIILHPPHPPQRYIYIEILLFASLIS